MTTTTDDLRITGTQVLRQPDELIASIPVSSRVRFMTRTQRENTLKSWQC